MSDISAFEHRVLRTLTVCEWDAIKAKIGPEYTIHGLRDDHAKRHYVWEPGDVEPEAANFPLCSDVVVTRGDWSWTSSTTRVAKEFLRVFNLLTVPRGTIVPFNAPENPMSAGTKELQDWTDAQFLKRVDEIISNGHIDA